MTRSAPLFVHVQDGEVFDQLAPELGERQARCCRLPFARERF